MGKALGMTRNRTALAIFVVLTAAALLIALGFAVTDEREDEVVASAARTSTVLGAPPPAPPVPARVSDPPGGGFVAEEARTVELGLPAPARFRPNGAERALAEFMDAWHDRAWDRMALWTTPPFRERFDDPGAELRRRYGAFRLLGWTIDSERLQPLLARFTVLTAYRDVRPQVEREELRLFALRFGGRWGMSLELTPRPEAGPEPG